MLSLAERLTFVLDEERKRVGVAEHQYTHSHINHRTSPPGTPTGPEPKKLRTDPVASASGTAH